MTAPAKRTARRILGVVALVLACALLFLIPSAYAIHRGLPRWAAAGAGALPLLLPFAWHGLGERRRRRAQGARPVLTGGDRFLFRLVAVAVVALGPLLALDAGGVWTALQRRSTWWLDWTDPPAPRSPVRDPRLLDAVPGDAEALVWSRSVEGLDEALLALGPDALLVVIHDAPEELDALRTDDLAKLAQLRLGYTGGVTTTRPAPDLMVIVSERWMDPVAERFAGGGTRPAALIDRLKAPPGASAVAVWRPGAGGPSPVVDAVGWVRDERIEAVMRVARRDAAAATRGRVRAWLDELARVTRAACAEDPGAVIDGVSVAGEGVEVRIRATLHTDRLLAYLGCLLGRQLSPPADTP